MIAGTMLTLEARLLANTTAADAELVRALRGRLWQRCLSAMYSPEVVRGRAATKTRSDGALLRAFQAGDAEAMDELLERHLPVLYGFALKHLRNSGDAEDCVQEALLTLMEALPGLEVRNDKALPLLFTFVKRRCADWVRREVVRSAVSIEELEQASDAPDALRQLLARTEVERLVDALASECTLAEQQVVLLVAEGEEAAAIATQLELTVNHVRLLKHRALGKLSRKLGGAS